MTVVSRKDYQNTLCQSALLLTEHFPNENIGSIPGCWPVLTTLYNSANHLSCAHSISVCQLLMPLPITLPFAQGCKFLVSSMAAIEMFDVLH